MKELDEASQGYKKESTEWIYNKSGTQNCFQVEFVVRPKGVIIYYTTKVQTQKGGNLSVLGILNFDTKTELMESNIKKWCLTYQKNVKEHNHKKYRYIDSGRMLINELCIYQC